MKILSIEDIRKNGCEFSGEICYSGEFGEQIYTKDMFDGGTPFNGLLYEQNKEGVILSYTYYSNGISNGQNVTFYNSGNLKSYCEMKKGVIEGVYTELFEDGTTKLIKDCQYGIIKTMIEYDVDGNIIREKKRLTEAEELIYQKRKKLYK